MRYLVFRKTSVGIHPQLFNERVEYGVDTNRKEDFVGLPIEVSDEDAESLTLDELVAKYKSNQEASNVTT